MKKVEWCLRKCKIKMCNKFEIISLIQYLNECISKRNRYMFLVYKRVRTVHAAVHVHDKEGIMYVILGKKAKIK